MIVPNPSTDSGPPTKSTTETNKMEACSKKRKSETDAGERKKKRQQILKVVKAVMSLTVHLVTPTILPTTPTEWEQEQEYGGSHFAIG